MKHTKVNHRQIAREVGVSNFTVSLALRNDPRVAAATRARVLEAAERLGYRRDPMVATLMESIRRGRPRSQVPNLAFFDMLPQGRFSKHPLHRHLFEAVKRRGDELGYSIEMMAPLSEGFSLARLREVCRARGIRGLVVFMTTGVDVQYFARSFDWNEFACVTFGPHTMEPPLHRVMSNNIAAMQEAIRQAEQRNYQRIGFAIPKAIEEYTEWRYRMVIDFYQKRIPSSSRVPVFEATKWNRDAFRKWLAEKRPDVVVTEDQHLLEEIRLAGHAVPTDLGFLCLSLWGMDSGITGLYSTPESIGKELIDEVDAQIIRNEYGPPRRGKLTLVDSEWCEGSTLRPL